MLFRICMVYLGNKEDVEEAMQEAFIKLIHNFIYCINEADSCFGVDYTKFGEEDKVYYYMKASTV